MTSITTLSELKSLRNHLDNLRIDVVDALSAVDRLIDSEREYSVSVTEIRTYSVGAHTREFEIGID